MTEEQRTDDQAKMGSILVVGGGISGLTATLEAAEVGYEVFLVEKNPSLGGRVSQLKYYFPKLCPPTCGLEINYKRIKDNPKVKYFTLAEVESRSCAASFDEASRRIEISRLVLEHDLQQRLCQSLAGHP